MWDFVAEQEPGVFRRAKLSNAFGVKRYRQWDITGHVQD